jgi:hypothetical protein
MSEQEEDVRLHIAVDVNLEVHHAWTERRGRSHVISSPIGSACFASISTTRDLYPFLRWIGDVTGRGLFVMGGRT